MDNFVFHFLSGFFFYSGFSFFWFCRSWLTINWSDLANVIVSIGFLWKIYFHRIQNHCYAFLYIKNIQLLVYTQLVLSIWNETVINFCLAIKFFVKWFLFVCFNSIASHFMRETKLILFVYCLLYNTQPNKIFVFGWKVQKMTKVSIHFTLAYINSLVYWLCIYISVDKVDIGGVSIVLYTIQLLAWYSSTWRW